MENPYLNDRVMDRLLSLQLGRIRESLARAPRPLSELVREEAPATVTRGGAPYPFDRAALEGLSTRLSPLTRLRLRVPIFVYQSHEVPGSVYVSDGAAIAALKEAGEVATEPRGGRLWMGEPLARDLARRWPTLLQFVVT